MPSPADYFADPRSSGFLSFLPTGPIVPGLFELDELGLLIGTVVVALILLLVLLCAPATRQAVSYTVLAVLFLLTTLATITATNVVTFFISWELTSLAAWGLGRLAGGTVEGTTAPFSAAGALASLLMFAGLLLAVIGSKSTGLGELQIGANQTAGLIIAAAISLKAFGALSVRWEQEPVRQFSLAGASLVGAALLVLGFYPALRILGSGADAPDGTVALLAAGLAILSLLAALAQSDVQRSASYGIFGQFAAVVFVISSGLPNARASAVLGALVCALAGTALFLCLGLVEAATGERSLRKLGGLAQRLPLLALLFVASTAALAGLPPFGGFVAGGMVGLDLWQRDATLGAALWTTVAILTVLYPARLFGRVFLGDLRIPIQARTPTAVVLATFVLLAGVAAVGLQPSEALALVRPALDALAG